MPGRRHTRSSGRRNRCWLLFANPREMAGAFVAESGVLAAEEETEDEASADGGQHRTDRVFADVRFAVILEGAGAIAGLAVVFLRTVTSLTVVLFRAAAEFVGFGLCCGFQFFSRLLCLRLGAS